MLLARGRRRRGRRAGRPRLPGLALAGDAELAAGVDAGRDLDLELALDGDLPWPPQSLQGVATMRPVPRQRPQVRATLKKPCWNVTWPAPPQDAQVVGLRARARRRCRWQVAQASARGIWMCVSVPKAASSKRQLEVVAQVGAAPRAAAAAAEDVAEAEEVAEDVAEVREDRGVEAAARRPGPAWP